jgi:heme/copper-type cytochrome/quinol oxidase subunit 2
MTEPAAETTRTRASNEPVEPTGEVARKNVMLALVLVAVVILVVAGTVAISLIYLHYD